MDNKTPLRTETTNPVKAIRAKCLDCCCGSAQEVSLCPCDDCALYPFRFGKNPYRKKKELTEKQRATLLAHAIKKNTDTSHQK